MKHKEANKNKIETAVEIQYRTEKKTFWFGGSFMMYCTQKEYDDYIKSLPEKSRGLDAIIKEKLLCDKIPFDGS